MLTRKSFFVVFFLALTSMSFATTFTCTGTNGVVVNGTGTSVTLSVPTDYSITATSDTNYVFKYGTQTIFTSSYTNAVIIVPEGGPAGDPGAGGEVQELGITTYTFADGSKIKYFYNFTAGAAMNPESAQAIVDKLSAEQYTNFTNLASGIDSVSDIQPLGWWQCFKIRMRLAFWILIGNQSKIDKAYYDGANAGCSGFFAWPEP